MTYTPKLPPRSAILDTWLRHHPFQYSSEIEDREAEFEMWEKQLTRKAKAEALTEAADTWQWGVWAKNQPTGDRTQLILGMAQNATDFLRNRAQHLTEES